MRGVVWRGRVVVAAAVVAVVLAGCGGATTFHPDRLIGGAAGLSAEIAHGTQSYLRHWCPRAYTDGGRRLTTRSARRCLRRARTSYLRLLHEHGYDPKKIVNGDG